MIGESFCPHCDMGIVPAGSKLPWTLKFRKCQHCHGDWRNYVKKPEPQPDVHPTNHMDPVGRRLCASWPSEDELRKLYQQPMADNPIPPFMDEHIVSQFGTLNEKERAHYSEIFPHLDMAKHGDEFRNLMNEMRRLREQSGRLDMGAVEKAYWKLQDAMLPNTNEHVSTAHDGPHYSSAEKAAREYSQLMELTLAYRREDVMNIACPNCSGMWVIAYSDSECQVCLGAKSVKVVVIRPPKP